MRVLGRFFVVGSDGKPLRLTSGARTLLAAFVAAGPEGASIDALAETRWGDELPERWQSSFRMAVSRLRAKLGIDVVSDRGGSYRLDLPTDAVDWWWLLNLAADEKRSVSEEELGMALAGAAFSDVDAGFLVTTAAAACARAQATVAKRFCAEANQLDARTATVLIQHQRSLAPFQEDLILDIASCLHRARKTAFAASYLDETLDYHDLEFGARPPGLVAFRSSLDVSLAVSAADGNAAPGRASTPSPQVPPLLQHVAAEPCVGRDDELTLLQSGRSFIFVGPLGSGKTRLLAAVAEKAVATGDHVSYMTSEASRTPYGPFLAAFPGLRSDRFLNLEQIASSTDGSDAASIRAAVTRRTMLVVEHLDSLAKAGRHWLLIDNVHDFDEASRRIIGFLATAETAQPMTIVIAARNDDGQQWLPALTSGLTSAGFGSLAIAPLGPAALEKMVGSSMPELTVATRQELARKLFARSDGLPAVARVLISTIDPETLTFGGLTADGTGVWSDAITPLKRRTVQVGVAAAVLGDAFAIDDVVALLERPTSEIDAALREMWDREIVIDGNNPSELRFANAWLRTAFLEQTPAFVLAELHTKAAAHTNDVHARADHEAAAVPRVPARQAVDSLMASARASMADGSWLEAVDALRRAIALADDDPDVPTMILLARALDRLGANGTGPRKVAFRRAAEDERWDLALEAAVSGLPEAERSDGDPDRIKMLEAIPRGRLDGEQRFDQALLLARQYALSGCAEDARYWVGEAEAQAFDIGRRVRTEIATWSVRHHVTSARTKFSDEVLNAATGHDRMCLIHMQMTTSWELDDLERTASLHKAFDRAAAEVGDPAGIWQAKVVAAALEFENGRLSDALALARDGAEYGRRHAIQRAARVFVQHSFYHCLIKGEQGQLVERFDLMPADTKSSAIASATRAAAIAALGRTDEAWREATPLIANALDRAGGSSLVVLAVLAGLVREAGEPDTMDAVRSRLAAFADHRLVVSEGVANNGPIHLQLAQLAIDRDEAINHLTQAVGVADSAGALTWQVVTRLKLAEATGRDQHIAAAARLAEGTELASLFD